MTCIMSGETMGLREDQPPRSTLRTLGVNFAHLAALSAFAVAQPLFDLLGRNPDFFAVRGSTRWDIVLFGLVVVVLPPAILIAVEAVAHLVSPRARDVLHLVFVAGLAGVIVIQALERSSGLTSTAVLVGLAVLLGVATAFLYRRLPPLRTLLTVLALAPVAFLGYFLFGSPVADLTLADEPEVSLANVSAQAPVVLVVFDEFPTSSLLDEKGEIDAVRYPNLAQLAQESTWFRHASTVSYSTTQAVPAILTGRRPEGGPPIFSEHPRNLFTLLGADYRMNVVEAYGQLCPKVLCGTGSQAEPVSLYSDVSVAYLHLLAPPRLEETLPPITGQWMNFGQDENEARRLLEEALKEPVGKLPGKIKRGYHDEHERAYRRFLASIEAGETPSLNYIHVFFPHAPWWHFPSGNRSSLGEAPAPGRDASDTWREPSLTLQAYQRHLLQVGFTDRLVGDLLRRLRETGMYDRSLVIVTADHGVSFRVDEPRRAASPANLEDIAFVPLLVKEPGQAQGRVTDYLVETIDVLPTIADVLGIQIPWGVEGQTAFEDPGRETVTVGTRRTLDPDGEATAPFASLVTRQQAAIQRRASLFGVGPWESLFAGGPHRELLGRPVDDVAVVASGDVGIIDHDATRNLLTRMDPDLPFVPSPLQGRVEGDGAQAGRMMAVAVNGKIAALATVYQARDKLRFSSLPPESVFVPGRNVVELFWVDGPVGSERLSQLQLG
jgi:Sulfatase